MDEVEKYQQRLQAIAVCTVISQSHARSYDITTSELTTCYLHSLGFSKLTNLTHTHSRVMGVRCDQTCQVMLKEKGCSDEPHAHTFLSRVKVKRLLSWHDKY